jgi:hypothetical protein
MKNMTFSPFSTTMRMVVIALLILPSGSIMHAQTTSRQAAARQDTMFRKNWDIVVDLLPLIGKEQVSSASIQAKYNFSRKRNHGHALRLRLAANYDDSSHEPGDFGDLWTNYSTTHDPMIQLGYEYRHYVDQKSFWYYGLDLGFRYTNRDQTIPSPTVGIDSTIEDFFDRSIYYSGVGFLGVQYRLFKNFSVSIESAFNCTYTYRHTDVFTYLSNDKENTYRDTGGDTYHTLNYSIRPIYTINIIYNIQQRKYEKHKT